MESIWERKHKLNLLLITHDKIVFLWLIGDLKFSREVYYCRSPYFKGGIPIFKTLRSWWIFDFVLMIFFSTKFLFGIYNFPQKKVLGFNAFKYPSYKHHHLLQHHKHHQRLQRPQHQQEIPRLTSSYLFQTMAVSD